MTTAYDGSDVVTFGRLAAARRALADDLKRDPATLARGLDSDYRMRPHLRVIAEAMAGVLTGLYDRLLVITPSQVGKSTLVAEWGPFWWFVNRPRDDIVIASYGADLAIDRSKGVRQRIADHGAEFGLVMRPGSESAHDWELTSGGHLRATGVQGGLSGFPANCLAYDTDVRTPQGPMPIGAYVESGCAAEVLSFDHARGIPVWASVVATSVSERHIVEVVTTRGRAIRCTADHRFYVAGRGYVAAVDLSLGDDLCTADPGPVDVRPLRGNVPAGSGRGCEKSANQEPRTLLLPGVQRSSQGSDEDLSGVRAQRSEEGKHLLLDRVPPPLLPHHAAMRQLWPTLRNHQIRPRETVAQRAEQLLLLQEVHGQAVFQRVPPVRCTVAQEDTKVLHGRMQAPCTRRKVDQEDATDTDLCALPCDIPSKVQSHPVLQPGLREHGALAQDDRARELPLPGRPIIRAVVPVDASDDFRAGSTALRDVQNSRDAHDVYAARQVVFSQQLPHPSRQRRSNRQPTSEPGRSLQDLPRHTPQVGHDTVAMVRPVRGDRVRVYDLQVAGTSNFFAGEVLVHNCLIVDDPHADRAQAESPRIRNAVHDWWSSTASKRLQPDVGVCIAIMTRWHPQDFAGRRLDEEGRLEEGGRWKVVHLPAVADPKFGKDPLGRAPGEPLTHPKIPTRDRARLAAWWADMKRTSIVRDWHSLAQGDPQPTEGALVSEELLRLIRDTTTAVEPQKIAVAVDPSGGGRDVAGIVGGFLGDDGRLWITHDRSDVMPSVEWSRRACLLAYETNAAIIYYERNYGGDQIEIVIRSAWDSLVKEGRIPASVLPPWLVRKVARQGKLLRAEPIAQQMILDRVRLRGVFVDMEREWATWHPTDPLSPGRIDASVYLAYGLLPIPSPGSTSLVGVQEMAQTNLLPWGR